MNSSRLDEIATRRCRRFISDIVYTQAPHKESLQQPLETSSPQNGEDNVNDELLAETWDTFRSYQPALSNPSILSPQSRERLVRLQERRTSTYTNLTARTRSIDTMTVTRDEFISMFGSMSSRHLQSAPLDDTPALIKCADLVSGFTYGRRDAVASRVYRVLLKWMHGQHNDTFTKILAILVLHDQTVMLIQLRDRLGVPRFALELMRPYRHGNTMVHYLCRRKWKLGQELMDELLIRRGFMHLNANHTTPIHEVIEYNITDLLEQLLQHERAIPSPSHVDLDGNTLLHHIAEMATPSTVECILRYRYFDHHSINIQNKYGDTPLHILARRGNLHVYTQLVQSISDGWKFDDPTLPSTLAINHVVMNHLGLLPFDVSILHRHAGMVPSLLEALTQTTHHPTFVSALHQFQQGALHSNCHLYDKINSTTLSHPTMVMSPPPEPQEDEKEASKRKQKNGTGSCTHS